MLLTHLSQITTLAMAIVCAWAVVAGRWPERATGLAFALNWVGSVLGQDHRPGHHGQPVIFALDILFCAFALALTASCRRTWVIWMAACTLLAVFTHLAVLLDGSFGQWTYQTAYYVWSLGALLAFGVGLALEGRQPAVWLVRFG